MTPESFEQRLSETLKQYAEARGTWKNGRLRTDAPQGEIPASDALSGDLVDAWHNLKRLCEEDLDAFLRFCRERYPEPQFIQGVQRYLLGAVTSHLIREMDKQHAHKGS
jgi:hypothetical protein